MACTPPRSPLVTVDRLSLNSPAVKASKPIKKSTIAARSRPASPVRGNSGSRSVKNSPTKTPGHGRTKSYGNNGGLGRMDVVASDWDAVASRAAVSPKKKSAKSARHYDRFIPNRENSSAPATSFSASTSGASSDNDSSDESPSTTTMPQSGNDSEHTANLTESLGLDLNRRILAFSSEPPPSSTANAALLAAYAKTPKKNAAAVSKRRVASMPIRVLDAPGLLDDYYLNLLDWSVTNIVAIALENQVYVWHADSGEVNKLCEVNLPGEEEGEETVTSVKFSEDGSYLAIGTNSGPIQIYDVQACSRIRTMAGHISRVPSLSWSGAMLSSGSRDGMVWNSDVRVAQHKQSEFKAHRAEVCGLAWRPDMSGGLGGGGQGLIATGGNDNVVNVWDGRNLTVPKMSKNNHTAAVKALAWCPWQASLLASGGGTNDKTIHFWNTTTSARLNSLTTNSQVTSLVWNPHAKEILSSHGFPDNQLSVWSYPTLGKIADINQAHDTRVLFSALSPDGCTVATASSDENLKFWNVFVQPKRSKGHGEGQVGREGKDAGEISSRRTAIR